jgi:hypothetical protein
LLSKSGSIVKIHHHQREFTSIYRLLGLIMYNAPLAYVVPHDFCDERIA